MLRSRFSLVKQKSQALGLALVNSWSPRRRGFQVALIPTRYYTESPLHVQQQRSRWLVSLALEFNMQSRLAHRHDSRNSNFLMRQGNRFKLELRWQRLFPHNFRNL